MGGLDMPPDISEIDADIRKYFKFNVCIDKISALTPDSFIQWGGNNNDQMYSPRNVRGGPGFQQRQFSYGNEM